MIHQRSNNKELVRIQVITRAPRDSIVRNARGGFDIAVREPAEKNRANAAALTMLARELGVPQKSLRIISGRHKPHKLVALFR